VCADEGSQFFTFDRSFGPEATQADVFEHVARPIIDGQYVCV
jgi:hypothetical protein